MERVYTEVNNGVYRCGFASSQEAYDAAYDRLWAALDWLEERLTHRRYLMGEAITEADVRLFTTLVRFDAVYHGHFKCNRQKLTELPALWGYARDLFQTAGFGDTVDFDQIKRHYYVVHSGINPTGIVPRGPDRSGLDAPPRPRTDLGAGPVAAESPGRSTVSSRAALRKQRIREGNMADTTETEANEGKGLKGGALGLLGSIVDGHRVDGTGVQPGREPGLRRHRRERRRHRRREGAADHGAGVHPDVLHRGRLLRAQQGRARLRDHVHLGGARVRHPHRLDGRLGDHRRRRHRDGEPVPDRRAPTRFSLVGADEPRGEHLLEHGRRASSGSR